MLAWSNDNTVNLIIGALGVLVGALLTGGAALVVGQRDRHESRRNSSVEAAADLIAVLGSVSIRARMFREWYPNLKTFWQRPEPKVINEFLEGLTSELARVVRAHAVLTTHFRNTPAHHAADVALDAVNDVVALAPADHKVSAADWDGVEGRLGSPQTDLKEFLATQFK